MRTGDTVNVECSVQPAERCHRRTHHRRARLGVGDVDDVCDGSVSNRTCQPLHPIRIHVREQDAAAACGGKAGDRRADPAGRAGDDERLALEAR